MGAALIHRPETQTNPYEPGPHGRVPRRPVDGETVVVCASGDAETVHVDWEKAGEIRTVTAVGDDGRWTAEIGPVTAASRYRFVSDGTATAWHALPVAQRRDAPFTGVRTTGDAVEVAFAGGLLRLVATDHELRAEVRRDDRPQPGATSATAGKWAVHVDEQTGRLEVRGPVGAHRLTVPAWIEHDDGTVEIELGWALDPDEQLLGTGERYDSLDQRGRTPDVRVYEQYKQQGSRTYFPQPFVLSTAGYAVHVDTAERVRFDLGATVPDKATLRIPVSDEALELTVWQGTPAEILGRFTARVGRPQPLPAWVYGPWMSGNEWNSDQRVREVVQRSLDEQIPATAIVIEAWADEASFYLFNDTGYELVDPSGPVPVDEMRHGEHWPDPKATVDWLHDQRLRVLLWQIPVLKDIDHDPQHAADTVHAEKNGYCVTTADGAVYRNRGWWFPGARIIDYTNPDARAWWFSKRAWLVDHLGVDGFKTDGGEHLWGDDVRTSAGEAGHVAANRYPAHYLAAYHEFLADHGHDRPVTFSRAGFTGSQATPAHWAGDEESTWDAYRASLIAGLSAGLSGIAYWSWDLAGFSGPLPSSELYQRAAAMACFCPIMQYHSEFNEHRRPPIDRTPWNVAEQTGDPAALDTYRHYAQLRMNLVPYLQTLGKATERTGLPIMRAMALACPDDPAAADLDDQYLLGPDLLVAPVLEPGARRRNVYLPAGRWYDLWDGTAHDGGWVEVDTPIERIPVFLRAGAAIPVWVADPSVTLPTLVTLPGEGDGQLALLVAPGDAESEIHDPRDNGNATVTVSHRDGRLVVRAPHLAGVPVRLVSGGTSTIPDSGVIEVTT